MSTSRVYCHTRSDGVIRIKAPWLAAPLYILFRSHGSDGAWAVSTMPYETSWSEEQKHFHSQKQAVAAVRRAFDAALTAIRLGAARPDVSELRFE